MGRKTCAGHDDTGRSPTLHGVAELNAQIEAVFRREYGRCVAVLTRFLGDISLAEEAVQEAFTIALAKWPRTGVPPSPTGWLITTARHRAVDRLRKEASRSERQQAAQLLQEAEPVEEHAMQDDYLRLIFTCCHPALAPEAQVALTLSLIAGLRTEEIARAFLLEVPTLAQRLTRAKAKIRDAGIPYRVPDAADLPGRLGSVLTVVYLVFNEGYSATSGNDWHRVELSDEAIRLGRLLATMMPQEAEVLGLLALMLLIDARRPARVKGGEFVALSEQDRALWDEAQLDEGRAFLRICLQRNRPGIYQLQAAINAVHGDAASAADTDWKQILVLYNQLMAIASTPVIALNRAVAVAEVHGAALALRMVDEIDLPKYHWYHAVRADLLRRVGRVTDAEVAYRVAIDNCANERERAFLMSQRRALTSGP